MTRIALRRTGRKPISLRVLDTVAGRYVICRDTPHKAGAFCAVLVLDLTTEDNNTFRPAQGFGIYGTESEARAALDAALVAA